jgi:hypothetical protein
MLDLVFSVLFKCVKTDLVKDPPRPVTEGHGIRMFEACDSAGASSTAPASVIHPAFIYVRGSNGGYTLASDEPKVQGAAEFWKVWDMDYAFEKLSGRRQASRRGCLNEDVFAEYMRS